MGMGMGTEDMDVDWDVHMMDMANEFRGELKLSMDSTSHFEQHWLFLNL